jgi:uncharacterized protein (DUF58 family)
MSTPADFRRYLDPRTLARVHNLELRAKFIVEGLLSGMHRSPFQGSSVEFAQHRQYVSGDDIRHVDWRVYGRNERIYIKQFQEETNLPLMLVVDSSESMGFGGTWATKQAFKWTKFDHATSAAAALAYLALHQQDAVGLAVFDQVLARFFRPVSSPAQWRLVIDELTHVPRWNKTDTGSVLTQVAEKLHHRSLVVVISDFFDDMDAIVRGLKLLRYRKHEVITLQILDHDEIDFPFDDVTMFKGLEEAGELLTEPARLRDAYLDRVKDFHDRFGKVCRSMGIDFHRFNTSEPIDVQLSTLLADRMSAMS